MQGSVKCQPGRFQEVQQKSIYCASITHLIAVLLVEVQMSAKSSCTVFYI